MDNNYFGNCAIIIARVSTPQQVLNANCSPQIEDLRKYAHSLGYSNLKEFGTTESGFLKEDSKQGWNLVTKFIDDNPEYKTIICTELSRLGRNEEVLMHIKNFLLSKKIQLIIKDINFELFNRFGETDPAKSIIFSIYASFAKAEMEQKKERFKRALTEYKKLGYSIGGKVLFGYSRICDGKLGKKNTYIINEKEAEEIKTIYDWYLYGIDGDVTKTSIAKITLECRAKGFSKYLHSKRNVNKCLKEKAYVGNKITHNRQKNAAYWNYKDSEAPKYIYSNSYECLYPPIISNILFEQVQNKLSKNDTHKKISNNLLVDKSREHITILSKIIRCPECGNFYIGDYRKANGYLKHTYRCSTAKNKFLRKCHNTKTISMIMLDGIIWSFIKDKVKDITNKMKLAKSQINIEEVKKEIHRLESSFDDLDNKMDVASHIYSNKIKLVKDKNKVKDEYQRTISNIKTEYRQLEKAIQEKKFYLKSITEEYENVDIDEAIINNINKIENSKKEMYKYVHLLIKSVTPLLTNIRYSIIEIVTFDNLENVFDYGTEDKNGLPYIAGEKHDNIYYICLDKRNTNDIRCRIIEDSILDYNKGINKFTSGTSSFSIEDIFNINLECDNPNNFHPLQRSVRDFYFKKLSFYDEDEK